MQCTQDWVLIIGVGNCMRQDDGAGQAVAQALQASRLDDVRVCYASRDGAALLSLWQGAKNVYLVDAMCSGAVPGMIHRCDARAQPLPAGLAPCSSHAFGVAQAVELARALRRMPAQLVIFGIEGRDFGMGEGLSAPVQRAVAAVVALIREEVTACRQRGCNSA